MQRGWFNVWSALGITLAVLGSGPLHAQFAYVVNKGSNSISGYTTDASTGALTPITGSPFALRKGSFPDSVAVDPAASLPT